MVSCLQYTTRPAQEKEVSAFSSSPPHPSEERASPRGLQCSTQHAAPLLQQQPGLTHSSKGITPDCLVAVSTNSSYAMCHGDGGPATDEASKKPSRAKVGSSCLSLSTWHVVPTCTAQRLKGVMGRSLQLTNITEESSFFRSVTVCSTVLYNNKIYPQITSLVNTHTLYSNRLN